MRRRKTFYPPAKTATKGGAATSEVRSVAASRVVSIDLAAIHGRSGLVPGMAVEVTAGTHAGEKGIVESLAGGVIPAVVVRTEAGTLRRVRTVDVAALAARPDEPEDGSG